MDKITIEDNSYFEVYAACPVCYERRVHGAASYWEHHGCGGQMYIGDDAQFYCVSCEQRSHVSKWQYRCPEDSDAKTNELDFQSGANIELAMIISFAGQITTAAGVPWLQKFLENLGN